MAGDHGAFPFLHQVMVFVGDYDAFALGARRRLDDPPLVWVHVHVEFERVVLPGEDERLGQEVVVALSMDLLHSLYSLNQAVLASELAAFGKLVDFLVLLHFIEMCIFEHFGRPHDNPVACVAADTITRPRSLRGVDSKICIGVRTQWTKAVVLERVLDKFDLINGVEFIVISLVNYLMQRLWLLHHFHVAHFLAFLSLLGLLVFIDGISLLLEV